MIDRHLLADIGLAVLLALPGISLARSAPAPEKSIHASSLVEKAALADGGSSRFTLHG